jgi:hypothetical protein
MRTLERKLHFCQYSPARVRGNIDTFGEVCETSRFWLAPLNVEYLILYIPQDNLHRTPMLGNIYVYMSLQ